METPLKLYNDKTNSQFQSPYYQCIMFRERLSEQTEPNALKIGKFFSNHRNFWGLS